MWTGSLPTTGAYRSVVAGSVPTMGNLVRAVAAMSAILVVLGSAACGRGASPSTSSEPVENPGDVIAVDAVQDVDPSLRAASGWIQRFTYLSRSGINDSITRVTAMLFVPPGQPPDGGWRVVAFGHPASGTLPECAPSLSPTLSESAPIVQRLLQAGYVVVMSDYQGLGSGQGPGSVDKGKDWRTDRDSYHPYLDSTTAGYNLIDSVRAARDLTARAHAPASESWLAFGIGQGGQAAWAADELVDNEGEGLTLLGSVAISPVANVNPLADVAMAGSDNVQQELDLQAFLAAVKSAYPDDVDLDDYRSGTLRDKWDALLACQGQALQERATLAGQITPDQLRPHTPTAEAKLRGFLGKTSLPQGPTKAPMLVIYGDHDPLIPAAWTDQALDRACKLGDVIQIRRLPDDAPDQLDIAEALDWMKQRVDAVPAPNDCAGRTS
jgi:pimeloyl-ACP methyl ester carboxylesterase